MKITLEINVDMGRIRDILHELDGIERTEEEAEKYFHMLSFNTKWLAYQWSTGDTVFGDEAFTELNKILFMEKNNGKC